MRNDLIPVKTYILTVTDFRDRILRGYLGVPPSEKKVPFAGLMQMLEIIQHLLDGGDQSWMMTGGRPEPQGISAGALATFQITVYFQQHVSWQGSVLWAEAQVRQNFRSTLELIMLIDRTLCSVQPSFTFENSGGEVPANPGKKGINCFE